MLSGMNHDELIAAIGRARGEPFEEISGDRAQEIHLGTMSMPPAGRSLSVLGGAISDERVAWVEENSGEMTGGYLPIDIDLKIASGGRTIAILPLET